MKIYRGTAAAIFALPVIIHGTTPNLRRQNTETLLIESFYDELTRNDNNINTIDDNIFWHRTLSASLYPLYRLKVSNGVGDGYYHEGAKVEIVATPCPKGEKFEKWMILEGDPDIEDLDSKVSILTMPEEDVRIKVKCQDRSRSATKPPTLKPKETKKPKKTKKPTVSPTKSPQRKPTKVPRPTMMPRTTNRPTPKDDVVCVTQRYTPWASLDLELQLTASSELNYDALSWNNPYEPIKNKIEKRSWDGLGERRQSGAATLGFTQPSWDCQLNHYESYDWDELAVEGVQECYVKLGYDEQIWGDDFGVVPADEKSWAELTMEEREGAKCVCYFEDLWNEIPIDEDFDASGC